MGAKVTTKNIQNLLKQSNKTHLSSHTGVECTIHLMQTLKGCFIKFKEYCSACDNSCIITSVAPEGTFYIERKISLDIFRELY